MDDYILEMKEITKTFPGVIALDKVNLRVKRAEVHALVGENGAGKSTLMKILDGVYQADSGEIWLNGHKTVIRDTVDARNKGIGLIFQECNLVNTLSVAENIYIGQLQKKGLCVAWKAINRDAQALLDGFGFGFAATKKVENLSAAQRQLVEIAKVLSYDARIVVMDEPTSSLTSDEAEKLFGIIEKMRARGITFIYISHKLDEIFQLCDTATILRDGSVIETRPTQAFTQAQIIERMVGRSVDMEYPRKDCPIGEVVLKLAGITRNGVIEDISFELRRGEILGIAGLVSSGRTETAEVIFGAEKFDRGTLEINGVKTVLHSTCDGKRHGVGLLTEDRKETGLVLGYDLARNITVTNLPRVKRNGLLSVSKELALATQY
ncbi:MAG: sugar ABC transporter ATP-binding protein, partial [Clostridia bacterium]